jgi:hypothetical protein
MRAATWRSGMPTRDQCGLTAMARSSGQAGAMAAQASWQACCKRCSSSALQAAGAVACAWVSWSNGLFMLFSG